jgi:hypothetical protein
MAIKTTGTGAGLRVLTKTVDGQVRVSCSCCEEVECCLYPAQGLTDGRYTWNDLPDELDGPDGIWTKFPEPDDIDQARVYESPTEPEDDIILGDGGGFWSAFASTTSNQCLSDPEWGFTDRFADTYTVEILFGDSAGSYIVTRRTTCVWSEFAEGEDFGGVRIIGGSLPDGAMSWSAGAFGGGQADQGFKLGDLNTPVGDYGETGTSETLIIVSEI